MNSKFLKLISSIPVILIVLYFLPFLGICLTVLRCFVHRKGKLLDFSKILILVGILILVPKGVQMLFNLVNFEFNYLNDLINLEIYNKLIKYSKFILTYGIILIIIYSIFKGAFDKLKSGIGSYIEQTEKTNYEISKENDLKIKEKQERAKTTRAVHCPFCGGDNILTEKTGKCKFCRRTLS
ncbi:MAG: hypothetical protein E7170_00540 [Firmicutes bacterium]|nr:hypothetical protein [Bacillota bacterium]